jgi:uncharacterized membrane protein
MSTARMEAFSDGVIAILITVMVLELGVPHGIDWAALREAVLPLLAYVLSFVYLGIYWNNHHHYLQAVSRVSGGALWANLHLLFWLSLVPFTTAWMSENGFAPIPTAAYGVTLLCAAIAYGILVIALERANANDSRLQQALGTDYKSYLSPVLYGLGIALSFVAPWIGLTLYVVVALIWLVPDRRIERALAVRPEEEAEA